MQIRTFQDAEKRVLADDKAELIVGDLNHICLEWSVVALCGKAVEGEFRDVPSGPVCRRCVEMLMRLKR